MYCVLLQYEALVLCVLSEGFHFSVVALSEDLNMFASDVS